MKILNISTNRNNPKGSVRWGQGITLYTGGSERLRQCENMYENRHGKPPHSRGYIRWGRRGNALATSTVVAIVLAGHECVSFGGTSNEGDLLRC